MDRVYAASKGYANPDHGSNGKRQYGDDMKEPYSHIHSIPGKMFDSEVEEEEDSPYGEIGENSDLKRITFHALRLILTLVFVGVLLGIPLVVTRNEAHAFSETDDALQNKNFVFWLFVWLEIVWIIGWCTHVFMTIFPYIFYGLMKWINPAHRRYWRVFRPLKGPVVCLMSVLFGWLFFAAIIMLNNDVNYREIAYEQSYGTISPTTTAAAAATTTTSSTNQDSVIPGLLPRADSTANSTNNEIVQDQITDRRFYFAATDVVDSILMMLVFWSVLYLLEKIVIVYVSVHYHYRSDHGRIERSKNLVNVLAKLYDTSLKHNPLYCDRFQDQDIIIRDAVAASKRSKRNSLKFFQKIGGASSKVIGGFGSMLGSRKSSHWFRPGNSYHIVEHALERSASGKALAQRIWFSLVPYGKDGLTKENIADALGMDGKDEAEKCMKVLDENENGDVRLTELEPMLVEAGKIRLNIYRNMQEIDHAINTLDWILLIFIALMIMALILFGWVDFLKDFKNVFGLIGLGLGAAAGRIVSDFFMGCVFILFKHPYDIGDRVDIWNNGEKVHTGMILKRISLLYCVFERTDSGAVVQYPNSRLGEKRIDNHSRSGLATEKLQFCVNIQTSFKDLEKLRDEMKAFLSAPENNRDYKPNVALRVKDINDFEKMEVAMSIIHKANWSIDALKSARSSRLYCKLIEIARTIPLRKPGDFGPPLGGEGKPNYLVVISEEEANMKRAEAKQDGLEKRYDYQNITNASLGPEAKKQQDEQLKQAEADAYKDISSIPATMAGRLADRPAGKPSKNLQSAQYSTVQIYGEQNHGRQRVHARSLGSDGSHHSNSGVYQGTQAGAGFQQQPYEPRRTGGTGLPNSNRQNRF